MILKYNAIFLGKKQINSQKTGKVYNSLWFGLEEGGAFKAFNENGSTPELEQQFESVGWGQRCELEIELLWREDSEPSTKLIKVLIPGKK